MVATYLAEASIARHRDDPSWLDGVELLIVPVAAIVANPDGFVYSQTSFAMWRKSRSSNGGGSCPGVDLNRNWDSDWNGASSTSLNPCSDIYVGSSPQSEPESQAIDALILEAQATVFLDLHSYGEMIPAAAAVPVRRKTILKLVAKSLLVKPGAGLVITRTVPQTVFSCFHCRAATHTELVAIVVGDA
ncbi:unnamed protein product [Prorocentrum cordatum]|uniref:Peptidase M14 domain-containing protein n=1 Tax=Prorocentrum cordatum TaxID=2364126 RepID=A0ABN9PAW3_9DINO|nr:unnamed protein product [Polarella glacialis]